MRVIPEVEAEAISEPEMPEPASLGTRRARNGSSGNLSGLEPHGWRSLKFMADLMVNSG